MAKTAKSTLFGICAFWNASGTRLPKTTQTNAFRLLLHEHPCCNSTKMLTLRASTTTFLLVMILTVLVTVNAGRMDDIQQQLEEEERNRLARQMAKPWLMRKLQITDDISLPVSPATLITLFILLVNILWGFVFAPANGKWCEASHILIKDTTNKKTKQALEGMVKDIRGNARKFGEMAEKYSQCPSSRNQGDLGRFVQGDMAPPFDKVCFDPSTKERTTIGPIETQFGYHLIYIRKRNL